jgi:hypothetical protein
VTVSALRQALTDHLGQTLTPEVACAIECKTLLPAVVPDFLDPQTGKFWVAELGQEEVRKWILYVTQGLLSLPTELQTVCDLKHTFLDGMYMREMFIPKGTLIVGKVHKQPCMNIVSKGDISILTEAGSARVKAGHSAISPAGTQKVGYAHEDTVFVNVFRTDATGPDGIEDVLAFTTDECLDMLAFGEARRLI